MILFGNITNGVGEHISVPGWHWVVLIGWLLSLLLIDLLAVEMIDIVLAIDRVPAILAISRDPFIVFSSTAAAILGLRALYFVFSQIKEKFWLLCKALGLLLVGVGIKMIISPEALFGKPWFGIHIPVGVSLPTIALISGGTVLLSSIFSPPKRVDK